MYNFIYESQADPIGTFDVYRWGTVNFEVAREIEKPRATVVQDTSGLTLVLEKGEKTEEIKIN